MARIELLVLAIRDLKHKGRGKKRRAKLKFNAVEDRIQREAGFEPLIPHEEWLTLVERSRRRGATQEGRRRPKQVQRYAKLTRGLHTVVLYSGHNGGQLGGAFIKIAEKSGKPISLWFTGQDFAHFLRRFGDSHEVVEVSGWIAR